MSEPTVYNLHHPAGLMVSKTDYDALEERERLRLAGISTAAIGYWKDGDTIHAEYDTVALRDVAKLYERMVRAEKDVKFWKEENNCNRFNFRVTNRALVKYDEARIAAENRLKEYTEWQPVAAADLPTMPVVGFPLGATATLVVEGWLYARRGEQWYRMRQAPQPELPPIEATATVVKVPVEFDDPPACPYCGAMAGVCDAYPNCRMGQHGEKQMKGAA